VILYHWQGAERNFGDELNPLLWPRLMPGFFDDNPGARFLGIGSVLDSRHPPNALKLVAGSGYGGYERKPALDDTWLIHWVRGPLTCAALGLPPSLALGDPALLLPLALDLPALPAPGRSIGFMPHFETMPRGDWKRVAALAGLTLIDPRDPPLTVIRAIRGCTVLLSEALHGVIVADALRVPWVAIRPLAAVHRAKWGDWSATMGLSLRAFGLSASCLAEWVAVRRVADLDPVRGWLSRHGRRLDGIGADILVNRAADALRRAAAAEPQMSADHVLDRCQSRMMAALVTLRRQKLALAGCPEGPVAARSSLRLHEDSAYQLRPIG
jgi:succinoglycan biosynthesis protein ExoV